MPVFRYKAYDSAGREASGTVEASVSKEAVDRLRKDGLFPREISLEGHREGLFKRRATLADLSSATRQLSALLSSGTPLFEAISVISVEAGSPALEAAFIGIKERIAEGSSLSKAFSEHPKIFPELLIRVVEAGEESGTLEDALLRAADHLDSKARFREKAGSALIYPALMTIVGIGVLSFLFVYVLPRITQIFDDSRRSLPLVTRVLFFIVNAVASYWPVFLAIAAISFWGARKFLKTERGREPFERALLGLPVAGRIYSRFCLANFAGTLGNLLVSGIPIMRALDLTSKVLSPTLYGKAISKAMKEVAEGAPLSSTLRGSQLFPATLVQMIATGEKSGELDSLLIKASGYYEREFDSAVSRALALLEPAMVLAMGLVVGFIVLAILLPIFELNQVIR